MTSPELQRKRIRVRHPRANTGCKDCRQRRVKCPEGPIDEVFGQKVACRRCWETDSECYYPSTSQKPSKLLKDVVWTRAGPRRSDTTEDELGSADSGLSKHVTSQGEQSRPHSNHSSESTVTCSSPFKPILYPPVSPVFKFNVDPNSLPTTGRQVTYPASAPGMPSNDDALDLTFLQNYAQGLTIPNCSNGSTDDNQLPTTTASPVDMFAPFLQTDLIKSLFNPSPQAPVSTFSLAAFPPGSIDRTALSYFESQGYNEIVSSSQPKTNWIYSLLFPQVYHLLSTVPSSKTGRGMIRDYAYHSLMQLSFVHRGNVEQDAGKAGYWKLEASRHRRLASSAVLKVKALKNGSGWKTEEYLMGFFVRCMADMLDSRDLVIDHTNAFELPVQLSSTSYPNLRDMIALYSTISGACTPLEIASARPISGPTRPLFELHLSGSNWVESFVGYSRQSIVLLGRVNGMVAYRDHLLRTGRADGKEAQTLRAQAEALSVELANPYAWEEPGKTRRVETGSIVLRLALLLMVLSELLEISLSDVRFSRPRAIAHELVADTLGDELAGFQWCLTIIAVYTDRKEDRETMCSLLEAAVSLSFGRSYQSTREIMEMCWEVYDTQGFYTNGIAPWREAMTAFGRTIVV